MAYIEWTGRNYEDQIDNLSEALDAADSHIEKRGYTRETLMEAEGIFAEIAFEDWVEEPDNWTLIID